LYPAGGTTRHTGVGRYHQRVIVLPPIPAGEPVVVSATLYTTYLRCPDQAFARLRGIYGEESRSSFKGSLAHRIFAHHLHQGAIPATEFTRACRREIGQSMNPKLASLGLKPSQLTAVIREVGDLYERFKSLSTAGFQHAEEFIEVNPAEGVTLRGSIDAVFDDTGGIRLVDWKTGGLYDAEQQLMFYALLWMLDRGLLPKTVEAVSIGSGERTVAEPGVADVTNVADQVGALVTAVRRAFADGADALGRIAGPWCRYCPLLDTCPEGAAAVRVVGA